MIRRVIPVLFFIILYASNVFGAKIGILPVKYQDADGAMVESSVIDKVDQVLVDAVKDAGDTPITGVIMVDAFATESVNSECDKKCLRRVAGKLGADDVILVNIIDEDQMNYSVNVTFAIGDDNRGIFEERTAGFYVVLEWLQGSVTRLIEQEPYQTISDGVDIGTNAGSGQVDGDETPTQDALLSNKKENIIIEKSRRKKPILSKTPFITGAIVSGVFAITWLISDISVHVKYKKLKSGEITGSDEFDSASNLQVFDRVMFGFTLAGLATTGVLALLTDFRHNKSVEKISKRNEKILNKLPRVKLFPSAVASNNGGMLSLQGKF